MSAESEAKAKAAEARTAEKAAASEKAPSLLAYDTHLTRIACITTYYHSLLLTRSPTSLGPGLKKLNLTYLPTLLDRRLRWAQDFTKTYFLLLTVLTSGVRGQGGGEGREGGGV